MNYLSKEITLTHLLWYCYNYYCTFYISFLVRDQKSKSILFSFLKMSLSLHKTQQEVPVQY